jgi:hypothetical protein
LNVEQASDTFQGNNLDTRPCRDARQGRLKETLQKPLRSVTVMAIWAQYDPFISERPYNAN